MGGDAFEGVDDLSVWELGGDLVFDGEVVGAGEHDEVGVLRDNGLEGLVDVGVGEGAGVDFGGPCGAVWFEDGEAVGVGVFEFFVSGGVFGGFGGEDDNDAVFGETGGGFDHGFEADELLVGVGGAKLVDTVGCGGVASEDDDVGFADVWFDGGVGVSADFGGLFVAVGVARGVDGGGDFDGVW